jgi:IS5 family transposase
MAQRHAGWPPLTLFRGLLLTTWHGLSDIKLAEALDNRTRDPS